MKQSPIFKFDQAKVIVTILMHEMYVICVYETSISIFNASSGDFLEEKGRLDKSFKYKAGVGTSFTSVFSEFQRQRHLPSHSQQQLD